MNEKLDTTYTVKELLAVFLAREIDDGERGIIGANSLVPRAALLLAHLLHGPNMKISVGIMQTNLFKEPKLETFELSGDWRVGRFAEYYIKMDEMFEYVEKLTDFFIISGIQVDKFGNTNLAGLRGTDRQFKMRGPGVGATTALAALVKRYYIYMEKHDRRRFVEKCDFISSVGWGTKETGFRESLKLPGGGPIFVLTPLCIMDFEPQSKQMRIKSVHSHSSVEEVIEKTGFDLVIPDELPVTIAPTEKELEVLRNRVDPDGLLR